MSKYRVRPQRSLIINFWLVQQRKWWGWRTIASFDTDYTTIDDVKRYIEKTKQLAKLKWSNE